MNNKTLFNFLILLIMILVLFKIYKTSKNSLDSFNLLNLKQPEKNTTFDLYFKQLNAYAAKSQADLNKLWKDQEDANKKAQDKIEADIANIKKVSDAMQNETNNKYTPKPTTPAPKLTFTDYSEKNIDYIHILKDKCNIDYTAYYTYYENLINSKNSQANKVDGYSAISDSIKFDDELTPTNAAIFISKIIINWNCPIPTMPIQTTPIITTSMSTTPFRTTPIGTTLKPTPQKPTTQNKTYKSILGQATIRPEQPNSYPLYCPSKTWCNLIKYNSGWNDPNNNLILDSIRDYYKYIIDLDGGTRANGNNTNDNDLIKYYNSISSIISFNDNLPISLAKLFLEDNALNLGIIVDN